MSDIISERMKFYGLHDEKTGTLCYIGNMDIKCFTCKEPFTMSNNNPPLNFRIIRVNDKYPYINCNIEYTCFKCLKLKRKKLKNDIRGGCLPDDILNIIVKYTI